MIRIIENFFTEWGFDSIGCFFKSLLKVDQFAWIITGGAFLSSLETVFGLNAMSMLALLLLMALELLTGIIASLKRKNKIKSKKLGRFLLKSFTYWFFIGFFAIFALQFKDGLKHVAFDWLHSFIVFYVIGVYAVSIFENLSSITGKRSEFRPVIEAIKKKLLPKKEKDEGPNE